MTKDIEREAFENALAGNKIHNLKVCTIYDDGKNEYFASDVCDPSEDHIVESINLSWRMWQAAKAQAAQAWINVDDRLPPVDETVLVCWDYAPDIEPEKEYTTIDENLDDYWPNCQDEPPTHWMPLPKVVKAQEPTND